MVVNVIKDLLLRILSMGKYNLGGVEHRWNIGVERIGIQQQISSVRLVDEDTIRIFNVHLPILSSDSRPSTET